MSLTPKTDLAILCVVMKKILAQKSEQMNALHIHFRNKHRRDQDDEEREMQSVKHTKLPPDGKVQNFKHTQKN